VVAVARTKAAEDLTRHKISDRETREGTNAVSGWMANTHEVDRRLSRGSLHRLVRPLDMVTGDDSRLGLTTNSMRITVRIPVSQRLSKAASRQILG